MDNGCASGSVKFNGKPKIMLSEFHGNVEIAQFFSVTFGANVVFRSRDEDSWFLTKDSEIIRIMYCYKYLGHNYCMGKYVLQKNNLFTYPCESSDLDIYLSDGAMSENKLIFIENLNCKMVKLINEGEFIFMPLLHSFDM